MRIRIGRCYSNGAYGRSWGVRMVRERLPAPGIGEEIIHYQGLAGVDRRRTGQCTLAEFQAWARYEVALNENSWQRVTIGDGLP